MEVAVHIACGIAGLAACAVIAYQDLDARSVHVLALFLLLGAGLGFNLLGDSSFQEEMAVQMAFNGLFITAILGVLAIYLRLRGMGFIDKSFGMGDLIYLYAAATWLGGFAFVLYFTMGTFLAILFAFAFQPKAVDGQVESGFSIPYAGILAILLPLAVALEAVLS